MRKDKYLYQQCHEKGNVILFCGLPATLKTFLAVRLSGRLGYGYLPSRAMGKINHNNTAMFLQKSRIKRYQELAKVVHAAIEFGANVVVDGGFVTSVARNKVLETINQNIAIIIHCVCDDKMRLKRLEARAKDKLDYENKSAASILKSYKKYSDAVTEESPEIELQEGKIQAVLEVNTSNMTLKWKGSPPKELSKKTTTILKELLKEYEQNESIYRENELATHFDTFADDYDSTTEWRRNKKILQSLQTTAIPKSSRVLYIGAGTGLASAWYAKHGHTVTGVDISPKMLQRASERLNLVLLGSGTKLPFINNYFDLIVIHQCLHYVEPGRLLKEAHRTLKKGGLITIASAVCPNEKAKHFWREFKNATQPLRLEVFTSQDIIHLVEETGFTFQQQINSSIVRTDKIKSLQQRARSIPGGCIPFLKNIESLASELFPELELHISGDVLTYHQYWVTIWAEK